MDKITLKERKHKYYMENRERILKMRKEYNPRRNRILKARRHREGISIRYNSSTLGVRGEQKPWQKTYNRIRTRCVHDKASSYYRRGIKCFITAQELRGLWFRDKAYNLVKPSIHRLNHKEDYRMDNCMYIELEANIKRLV